MENAKSKFLIKIKSFFTDADYCRWFIILMTIYNLIIFAILITIRLSQLMKC